MSSVRRTNREYPVKLVNGMNLVNLVNGVIPVNVKNLVNLVNDVNPAKEVKVVNLVNLACMQRGKIHFHRRFQQVFGKIHPCHSPIGES
jgi:hypothetical protein